MQSTGSVRDLKESLDRRKQVEIPPNFFRPALRNSPQWFHQIQLNNYKNFQPRVTSKLSKEESRKTRINFRQVFDELSRQWHEETSVLSSTTEICNHPAYLEIIKMGDKVIPFILKDLQESPSQWFSALRSITGNDPISPQQRGRVKLMAQAWIDWGVENGYINQ
jgi:hypothetical protein